MILTVIFTLALTCFSQVDGQFKETGILKLISNTKSLT